MIWWLWRKPAMRTRVGSARDTLLITKYYVQEFDIFPEIILVVKVDSLC